MKKPIFAANTQQPGLGLLYNIERTQELLDRCGLNVFLVPDQDFGFDVVSPPEELHYFPIELCHVGHENIVPYVAHERLVEKLPTDLVALDLYAISALCSSDLTFPDRPIHPKKDHQNRLIILTAGLYSRVEGGEYEMNVCLKEREDGEFDICAVSRYCGFQLYLKPGWDLVALCAPSIVCTKSENLNNVQPF